jgi:hypothetical protein
MTLHEATHGVAGKKAHDGLFSGIATRAIPGKGGGPGDGCVQYGARCTSEGSSAPYNAAIGGGASVEAKR